MKKQLCSYLILLFVAFWGSHALGQPINIKQRDSLLQVLQQPGLHDTVRIKAYLDIASFYNSPNDSLTAIKYLKDAEAVALRSGIADNIVWVYSKWTRWGLPIPEVLQAAKNVERYYPEIPEMSERRVGNFISIAFMLKSYGQFAQGLKILNDIVPFIEKRDKPENLMAELYQIMEETFSTLKDHLKAVECANKSIEYALKTENLNTIYTSYYTLSLAYYRGGRFDEAIKVAEFMRDSLNQPKEDKLETTTNIILDCFYKEGKHEAMIDFLNKEMSEFTYPSAPYFMTRIGQSYSRLGKYDLALQSFDKADKLLDESKADSFQVTRFRAVNYLYRAQLNQGQGSHSLAIPLLYKALSNLSIDSMYYFRSDYYWDALKSLILSLQATGRYEAASSYQNALLRSMQKELDEDASLKGSLTATRQQEEKRIVEKATLEAKNTQQRRFLWGLGIGLAVMAGLGGVIWRQSKALGVEKKKSEALLLNMLPDTIASRMKLGEHSIADYFEEATVIFIDMVGFTQLSSESSPKEVVKLLNHLFSKIDQLTGAYGLEKIKTIGDCYMAVAGIPNPTKNHLETALQFCKAVLDELDGFEHEGRKIHFKIGVETGPAVAGIIGERRFLFDLWGDTVNMASRMETNGVPSAIQVTANVFEKMKDQFPFEPRGMVEIKGKGSVEVFLMRKEGV